MAEILAGKVAIVTGAGRHKGIGRYIALALARGGADVVVTGSGRPPETFPETERAIGWRDIESVAEEIRAMGRRSLPLVTDMTKSEDAQRLVSKTVSELGRIDILVNNAAAGRGQDRVPVIQLEESEWRRVLDLNLTGAFLVTKAVGAKMVEQGSGGRIVNISSILGRQGMVTSSAYSASKAGLLLLTQVLALELAPEDQRQRRPALASRMDGDRSRPIRDMVMRTTPLAVRLPEEGDLGFPVRAGGRLHHRSDHQH
jgi:NAD(P)-dependent dehydrogenase (short-subunit alcohol dehydrogenase family)